MSDGTPPYADRGQQFIDAALSADPPAMLVAGVWPARQSIAAFGAPRTRKTWVIEECLVAIATGTHAFCDPRFAVGAPAPVLYITNEDSAHSVAMRIRALLAGRGFVRCPEHLHFRVRKATWLDDGAEQDRLIAEIIRESYVAVGLDPLRSLTGCVDKGPADFAPFGRFMRDLLANTTAAPALGHHTTKPPAVSGPDNRSLPDRMSGGGLFSYVDAPLAVERIDEHRSQITPTFWKHCPDPPPIMFTLETDDPQYPTVARLRGELAASDDAKETALQARIVDHLRHNPGLSSNKVAGGVRANKQAVQRALEALEGAQRVDRVGGPRGAYRWFSVSGSSGSGTGSEPVDSTGSPPIRGNRSGTSQRNQWDGKPEAA